MRPRRRRALAAPFVVTAVLAPGCGSQPPPPAEPTPQVAPTPAETTAPTSNTEPDPGGAVEPAPAGKGSWAESAGQWIYTYESGDRIWYSDGTCELHMAMDCPAGATCNPPPPRAVACPDGLPAEAKK